LIDLRPQFLYFVLQIGIFYVVGFIAWSRLHKVLGGLPHGSPFPC
jgi:hypothetical protein